MTESTKKAIRLYKKGFSIADIALALGKDKGNVRKSLIREGVHHPKEQPLNKDRVQIIEQLKDGKSLQEISKQFGTDIEYLKGLVYRIEDRAYRLDGDKAVLKEAAQTTLDLPETPAVKVKKTEDVTTKEENTQATTTTSDNTRDGLCTIMLDAMIKSDEGTKVLTEKGIFTVAREIEKVVDGLLA